MKAERILKGITFRISSNLTLVLSIIYSCYNLPFSFIYSRTSHDNLMASYFLDGKVRNSALQLQAFYLFKLSDLSKLRIKVELPKLESPTDKGSHQSSSLQLLI